MKKFWHKVAFCTILLCPTAASGQVIMSTPIYPFYSWRARTLRDIDLTQSQKQQVDSIAKAYWEMLHRIDGQLRVVSRDSLGRWLTSIRNDQLDDIRTLLTAKQKQVFDRNRLALTRSQLGDGRLDSVVAQSEFRRPAALPLAD